VGWCRPRWKVASLACSQAELTVIGEVLEKIRGVDRIPFDVVLLPDNSNTILAQLPDDHRTHYSPSISDALSPAKRMKVLDNQRLIVCPNLDAPTPRRHTYFILHTIGDH
jgi:hypothetical protein